MGKRAPRPYDEPRRELLPGHTGSDAIPPDIARHLTEEERDDVRTPGQVRNFIELYNRLPSRAEVATGAELGRAKRGWYQDAAHSLVHIFGEHAPRFAALLGATSPNKGVKDNLRNAAAVYNVFMKWFVSLDHPPTAKEIKQFFFSPEAKAQVKELGGYYSGEPGNSGEVSNIARALGADHDPTARNTLSGPKIDSFSSDLQATSSQLHRLQEVTNDTWMAYGFGLLQNQFGGSDKTKDELGGKVGRDGRYVAASVRSREAAEWLNQNTNPDRPWHPAEVQETFWSAVRTLAYLGGEPRRRGVVGPDPIEALRGVGPTAQEDMEGLTHEWVRNNADFATLLTKDEVAANALKAIPGFEHALDGLSEALKDVAVADPTLAGRAVDGLQDHAGWIDRWPLQDAVARKAGAAIGGFVHSGTQLSKARCSAKRRRYADEALVASSSNTEKEMSFDEAFKRVTSGDQAGFKQMAGDMAAKVGLKATVDAAVGDWEDGAEHSVLTQIPGATDIDTLRYVGAWQGLTGNQRSVLVFRPEQGGTDSVYTVKVPETDVSKVRAQLSRFGIPYRTIVPGKTGTRVVVYDQKRALRQNVSNFAQVYNAVIREALGRGEYVGGSSRSAARAAYRKIIAEYEAKHGQGGRGAVREGQAPELDRGGRAQTA